MTDIFISYRSAERSAVAPLARALEDAGYSVWWDAHLEVSPHPYPRQIEKALAGAKAVIVCWSPEALSSDWVVAEASAAREAGKLMQVKIRSCALPPPFNVLETADLSEWRGNPEDAQWKRVVSGVAGLISRPLNQPKAHENRFWRAIRIPAVAIAAVLTVSLLAFQNVSAICDATGLFCPSVVREESRSSVEASPQAPEQVVEALPAECSSPRLASMLDRLQPALGRASVRICTDVGCGVTSVNLNQRVRFEVSSNVPGTIVALDVDESGNEVQLLPNTEFGGGFRIESGEIRRIPGEREFVASEVERGCVLVIVGPSRGAFGEQVERDEVMTRGFSPAPETSLELSHVIADARASDAAMSAWAFGWVRYDVRQP